MSAHNPAPPDLQRIRHSCAHLLAAAVHSLYPNARFGVGPATASGFFYDVEVEPALTEHDLPGVEERMRALAAQCIPYERLEMPIEEAKACMAAREQTYKLDLLHLLQTKGSTAVARETGDGDVADGAGSVSLYRTGAFVDVCRGPHVAHTGLTGAFRLRSIAGAYWRGNESGPQLQRIQAYCYATAADLAQAMERLKLAAQRDHRKLGKELHLFAFSPDVGPGLPLWLPHGTVLRDELEHLARTEERRAGYQRIVTPHLAKEALYRRSGHLPYYAEDMYQPIDVDGEKLYLRPMNCPHHHQVFASRPRSYRELPQRFSEYGQVYRYEATGGLSGLMRVRGFCQNDAHLYCRADQAKDEFLAVMRLHARYYEMLGIADFWMRLSLPDDRNVSKYVADADGWHRALAILREATAESGLPCVEVEGEAAFYGPKVDFMIRSVAGTEYAISTNQLDFVAAQRFGLHYVAADGSQQPVYVIHRAPLGSHERFVAFLIEQFAGAFPVWLAPVQARLIPIADRHNAYAEQVRQQLFDAPVPTGTGGLRVDADLGAERMQKKIRFAQQKKIPYMLVVGDAEQAEGSVTVRHRSGAPVGTMPVGAFVDRIAGEIAARRDKIPSVVTSGAA